MIREFTFSVPEELPSWNTVMNWHHYTRNKKKDAWHELVEWSFQNGLTDEELNWLKDAVSNGGFEYLFRVVCYRPFFLDWGNVCYKFAEDALKGVLVPDDSPKFCKRVELEQIKIKQSETKRTEFTISVVSLIHKKQPALFDNVNEEKTSKPVKAVKAAKSRGKK